MNADRIFLFAKVRNKSLFTRITTRFRWIYRFGKHSTEVRLGNFVKKEMHLFNHWENYLSGNYFEKRSISCWARLQGQSAFFQVNIYREHSLNNQGRHLRIRFGHASILLMLFDTNSIGMKQIPMNFICTLLTEIMTVLIRG